MQIDFSAAELALEYLDGKVQSQELLAHPAYQVVCRHAARYGEGIDANDLKLARQGLESRFYGLQKVDEHRAAIQQLLTSIRANQGIWLEQACQQLTLIGGESELEKICIYPIIGYDMGIGLENTACLNCNTSTYLQNPQEFLYYVIHECVHILYEHRHALPTMKDMLAVPAWLDWFALWTQNEGYAVYIPWQLRKQQGQLQERDYQVLEDPARMQAVINNYRQACELLSRADMTAERALELIFGDQRLTYRIGALLISRIERLYGLQAVRSGFDQAPRQWLQIYSPLLDYKEAA